MRVLTFFAISIMLCAYAQQASSQDFDTNYVKRFGWGSICVSDKGLPPRKSFDSSFFNYKNGMFYLKADPSTTFNVRFTYKDGKTLGQHIENEQKRFKKSDLVKDSVGVVLRIWTSHDINGKMIDKGWPNKFEDRPKWEELGNYGGLANDNMLKTTCDAFDWGEISGEIGWLKQWMQNSKPGYKIYMAVLGTFEVLDWLHLDALGRPKKMRVYTKPLSAGVVELY